MKKLISMILVVVMMLGVLGIQRAVAGVKTSDVNGMVFLYFKFPAVAYEIFTTQKYPYAVELQNPHWAGLINQGEIKELHIRIPLIDSFIYVYYKNPDNFVRRINLKFYSIGPGYILFIFKGEIS